MLDYDEEKQSFKIKVLEGKFELNKVELNNEWTLLNELDEVTFSCGLHSQVHLWRFSIANGGLKLERPDKLDSD